METIRLLFVSRQDIRFGPVAAALAQRKAPNFVSVASAGLEAQSQVDPLVIAAMQEVGINLSDYQPRRLDAALLEKTDIVIALYEEVSSVLPPFLPGSFIRVDWNLRCPSVLTPSIVREFREEIQRLVDDFFERGYLRALVGEQNQARLILDHLSEGIIAHDHARHIVFFNQAAERLTGYNRNEVMGRDCHEVFPVPFCGSRCAFCEGTPPPFDVHGYPVEFLNKEGERKQFDMRVKAILTKEGKVGGVLASFRDLTEEYRLARRLGEIECYEGMISRDPAMIEIFDLIRNVAEFNVPVLIQGESGTGKELVARAIHRAGPRALRPFVAVNCGALPEGLLESELFGHVRGAFTGAIRDKKGRFELADGGTIFLDEIGDISPAMQVKLLRVLQEGTFERVGGTQTIHVDVRLISATNKNIPKEIAAGRFREDLYYRLCVVPITLPPLRNRPNDIPLLANHLLQQMAKDTGRSVAFAPETLGAMIAYPWPGNIRELQNAIQYMLVRSPEGILRLSSLPPTIRAALRDSFSLEELIERGEGARRVIAESSPSPSQPCIERGERRSLRREALPHPPPPEDKGIIPRSPSRRFKIEPLDPSQIREAMVLSRGNKAAAAKRLGISRATLYRLLATLPPESGEGA